MKTDRMHPGMTFEFSYRVPDDRTVPYLLPESPEFRMMPRVLATGYMVGIIEWACIRAINPHIDWPREQSVGIAVNLTHSAATPAGLTVTVRGMLEKREGRKLTFSLVVDDGVDRISEGFHERYIINATSFQTKADDKSGAKSTP
jgi:fluoroacetyl-CoA thioesterase